MLPLTGSIDLNEIHVEAGGVTGTTASLNDADIRALITSTANTEVSFDDFYGASFSKSVQFDIEGARGGAGDLNTQWGNGGKTLLTYDLSASGSFNLYAGGRGEDGNAAAEAGGGGAGSYVTMLGSSFAVTIGVAGGGGGAGYADLGTANRGRGGFGAGYSGIWTAYTSYPYYLSPGLNGFSDDGTPDNFGPLGGTTAEAKGGEGGGQQSTRTDGGRGGTGRYAGNAGTSAVSSQGGLVSNAGGRGGESSAGNTNTFGGSSGGTQYNGGIGGNAIDASDSGGGGGGGGAPSGGGGAGGAYGAGGGGGGSARYDGTGLNSIPQITPTAFTGTNGARGAAGRIRVYVDGVLDTTLSASGITGASQALTITV